jgi:3-hydroxybutyryl-CoA dehydrogenase
MGPFELMDLVGLDVGLAVSRSFYEQSFGEPRWRPSPLVARRVAAGHLGRKSGRGWYEYPPGRPADPESAPMITDLEELGDELPSVIPPLGRLVEVTPDVPEPVARKLARLGLHVERVEAPVLPRIVAQLVNEACFALGEGAGSAADIDAGMEIGLNHPRGPLAWGDLIGPERVLAILNGLQDAYRDDRFRPAPRLLRAVRTGEPLA